MFFFLSSSSSSSGFLSGPCNVDESTRNPKKNEKRNQITKKQKKGTHRVTIWQRRRAVRSLSIAFLVLLEFFVVLFDI